MSDDFQPVLLTRDPATGPETLAEYRAAGGYQALARALDGLEPAQLIDLVEQAGLTGRGGAGFPTARKWRLAASSPVTPRYVVANGGEHEPGSRKDAVLMATHPHRVLEGLLLAGRATAAQRGWLYLLEEQQQVVAALDTALAEARAAGLVGAGILGSAFDFEVELALAPASYVAGEETAALQAIEGAEAKPREKPPWPGEQGLYGKPTTVNNVETLAQLPGIVRHGAEWFRALGRNGGVGSMLFTLDQALRRPGVYELPVGASFRELIEGCGGGLRSGAEPRAIQPARSSAFLTADALELPMEPGRLRERGSGLGCGGVLVLGGDECVACRTLEIAEFFMQAQCGQCSPCRMATNTYVAVLRQVIGGSAGGWRAQLDKVAGFTRGKGYCSLIGMATAPLLSAIELFGEDFDHHAQHGACRV